MRTARQQKVPTVRSLIRSMLVWVFVVVIVSMGANAVVTAVTDSSVDTVLHSLEPLDRVNAAVLQSLTDAETGLRGYQMTGRQRFLQPYRLGLGEWPGEMEQALSLVSKDPTATRLLLRERAAAAWVDRFAVPIVSGRLHRESGALDSRGKRFFDRLRATNQTVAAYIANKGSQADRAVTTGMLVKVIIPIASTLLILLVVAQRGLHLRRLLVPPLETLAATLDRVREGGPFESVDADKGAAEARAVARALNEVAEDYARIEAGRLRRERLKVLSGDLSRRLRDQLHLEAVLEDSVRDVGTALALDRVGIRLMTKDGSLGPPAAVWNDPASPSLPEGLAGAATYSIDAVKTDPATGRQAIISNDLERKPLEVDGLQRWLILSRAKSCVIYPLQTAEATLGVLAVSCTNPRDWSEEELDILETASDDIAMAIAHAQLYEKERQIVAELQELDKAKSDFLSTVSHELRTPLTSINGYVELLSDGEAGPVTVEQAKMLGVVSRNVACLRGLIEDLLTLSCVEAGTFHSERVPVGLASALQNAALSIAPMAAEKDIGLFCEVDDTNGVLAVEADPVQLDRVVDNLLSNAVKFTPSGGEVRLHAEAVDGAVEISVSDTGIGIPEAEQAHLFGRFFRASNAVEQAIPGTGLGLSIVQVVVEQHGGTLRLASAPGKGTTITVRLPPLAGRESQEPIATEPALS
jgi:two-component system phosphate regulon sensor histidine kinase PhoR